MRRVTVHLKAVIASLVVVFSLAAVTAWALNQTKESTTNQVALSSASGKLKIYNSKAGKAILTAKGMVPGKSVKGSVRVGNPNKESISIVVAPKAAPVGELAKALVLTVDDITSSKSQRLFTGPLSGFEKSSLGKFTPGKDRRYQFEVTLPSGVSNQLQGAKTSISFLWRATSAGPPPECRVRAMRTRFFIFRNRPFIRLVTRYKATAPGKVVIRFYWRKPGNRFGRQVGKMTTRFGRSPNQFRLRRVWLRRTPAQMRSLRRSKRGFMAQIRPVGSPGYCRSHLNLELSDLRRKFGQFVWFQKGSFQRR